MILILKIVLFFILYRNDVIEGGGLIRFWFYLSLLVFDFVYFFKKFNANRSHSIDSLPNFNFDIFNFYQLL